MYLARSAVRWVHENPWFVTARGRACGSGTATVKAWLSLRRYSPSSAPSPPHPGPSIRRNNRKYGNRKIGGGGNTVILLQRAKKIHNSMGENIGWAYISELNLKPLQMVGRLYFCPSLQNSAIYPPSDGPKCLIIKKRRDIQTKNRMFWDVHSKLPSRRPGGYEVGKLE